MTEQWTKFVTAPEVTAKQREQLDQLLAAVLAHVSARSLKLAPADEEWLKDEGTRSRYARARQWDNGKATEMILYSLEWRIKMRPESILAKDMEVEARTGKVWVSGKDRMGRPIVILDNASQNTDDIDNQMRYLAFCLIRAIRMMENQVEKVVVFINLSRWSLRDTPPMRAVKETIDILSNQFPERLGLALCFNGPWLFEQFFGAVKYFIDPVTVSKIAFLGGDHRDGSEAAGKMQSVFGDDWRKLTGVGEEQETPLSSPGYHHQIVWPAVVEEEAAFIAKTNNNNNNAK